MKMVKKISILLILVTSLASNAQTSFKVEVKGEGQPVLLFPGFTCTGEVWNATVTELSKNYECHIFTFAGFGGVAPIEKPWLPKIKTSVEDYVKERRLEKPIIIGHSLGGALGLWLTTEENHPFSKLIVVDALPATGALMIPNFKSENMAYESLWNKQMLDMDEASFEKMATQMASGMTLTSEKHEQLRNWILQADRETYVYGYTDLLKLDLREDISKIKIPVVILGATEPFGLEVVKKNFQEQYMNLEDYEIEYAEGSAHFIMYDKPEWFLNQIKKHVQ